MASIPLSNEERPSTSGVEDLSNVVYIGNLPHGFYDKELLGYFSQFGKVNKVRMAKNRKSGRSKHYAYLQFDNKEVGRIAAEAMHGYFLFKQQLKCRVLKEGEVHPLLFRNANRKFRVLPRKELALQQHNQALTPALYAKRVASLIKKDRKRQQQILQAGIDYDYPALELLRPAKSKKVVYED